MIGLPITGAAFAPNTYSNYGLYNAAVPQFNSFAAPGFDIPMTYNGFGLANFNQKPQQANLQNLHEPKRHHHHSKSHAKKGHKAHAQKKGGKKVEEDIIIQTPYGYGAGYPVAAAPYYTAGYPAYANYGYAAEAVASPVLAAATAPVGVSVEGWQAACPGWQYGNECGNWGLTAPVVEEAVVAAPVNAVAAGYGAWGAPIAQPYLDVPNYTWA